MIRIVIEYDPATGRTSLQCAAPPAVANAILDLAKGACVQAAVEQLAKQTAEGISVPTPAEVSRLIGVR